MKAFITTLFLTCCLLGHAQQVVTDTLTHYLDRSTSMALPVPVVSNEGFIFGTSLVDMFGNGLQRTTDRIGMPFDTLIIAPDTFNIQSVAIYFGYIGIRDEADQLEIAIYTNNAGFPGDKLGGQPFTTDMIQDVDGGETMINFSNPVTCYEDFFVVLEYTFSDDTFAIYSNNPMGDAEGQQRAVQRMDEENFSGNWYKAEALWNLQGLPPHPLDCDVLMAPVISYEADEEVPDTATAISELATKPITAASLYPNPSNERTTVEFQLAHSQEVEITLINGLGQTLQSHRSSFARGEHRFMLELAALTTGTYFVQLRSEEAIETLPLQVTTLK